MKWLKVIFVSLEMFSLIGRIFSSTLFTFGKEPLFLDRYREMEKNVHRGLLLSLRAFQKNEICQNIYGSQLYLVDNMDAEGKEFYGRPYYVNPVSNWRHAYWDFFRDNLTVGKMGRVIGDTWKLYIRCTGKYFGHRKPKGKPELFLSYAFKSKWFVVEREYEERPNQFLPSHYAVISPDFIALKLGDLEEYFVNVQRNIGNLRIESPDYMTHVEGRDTFSNLSKWQKLVLCASILSSKIFHKERLEFSFDWMNDVINKRINEPLDYEKKILLTTIDSTELPEIHCILCKAVEDVTEKNSKTTNVYVTRSYRDSYSAFVLIERSDGIFLHSGFRNIPVLMPGHEDMNVHKLFLDIDNTEPKK